MEKRTFTHEIDGRPLTIEVSDLAGQANGSVLARFGETVVLATAVMAKTAREGIAYFPLLVDYEERFYAAGKISGSRFIKREGRPSEEAILTGRLIDRALRPRFNQRMRNDVQVVLTVLSFDGANDPDIPALVAASTALTISDIPWAGPLGAVRVSKNGSSWRINPTYPERTESPVDLVAAGVKDRINMLEARGKEVPEGEVLEAITKSEEPIQALIRFQEEIQKDVGRAKAAVPLAGDDPELEKLVKGFVGPRLQETIFEKEKGVYQEKLQALEQELLLKVKEAYPEKEKTEAARLMLEEEISGLIHEEILKRDRRPDGRALDEVRPLEAVVGVLPRTHGSGLFIRGETQTLSLLTLASPGKAQLIETMEVEATKRFMHHYNFPPYSVGEVSPMRGPGRREIGHGALVERALEPLIPPKETFPYTIRIVSETLSSNGSSSMASVSSSSLALFDAGVPIKQAVAGIAMGLMTEKGGEYKILTDHKGPEEHQGDMDFKVAGTRAGITAIQLDVKFDGLTREMIEKTLAQARKARLEILDRMEAVIPEPRKELSPFAPRIIIIHIPPEKIGLVIGPQGKMINEIIRATDVSIDVEDTGEVFIAADRENPQGAEKAKEWIESLTHEVKEGETYEGTVTRLMDFGAIVEFLPGKDGMVHISEMSSFHVNRVEDILKVGDTVKVRVLEVHPDGKISLSMLSPAEEAEKRSRQRQAPLDARPRRAHDQRRFPHGPRTRHSR